MTCHLARGDGSRQLLVVFSIDGAELHASSSGVLRFMRVLNQVEFINRLVVATNYHNHIHL